MSEYIERDKLIAEYDRVHQGPPGGARKLMVDAPAADVVARAAYDQVAWERDLAIEQLREDYGVGLGEKKPAGVVVLPCKIGTHLWRVTHPYRQEPKVTEFVVKNFRTVGKRHQLQLEVQAVNVPGTNWMAFSSFKHTYEEAEMELMKMDGGADNG